MGIESIGGGPVVTVREEFDDLRPSACALVNPSGWGRIARDGGPHHVALHELSGRASLGERAVISSAKVENYPGETSTVDETLALADEFRNAAEALASIRQTGQAMSTAPFRLLCIHAIELYLNAFLRSAGQPAPAIRGLQHNMAARLELVDKYGLVLRHRTRLHLATVSANREYLASRYDPDATTPSQLNRLQATLTEVRSKVLKRLEEPRPVVPSRAPSSVSRAGLAVPA